MELATGNPTLVEIFHDYDSKYDQLNLIERIRKRKHSFAFDKLNLNVLNHGKGPGIE